MPLCEIFRWWEVIFYLEMLNEYRLRFANLSPPRKVIYSSIPAAFFACCHILVFLLTKRENWSHLTCLDVIGTHWGFHACTLPVRLCRNRRFLLHNSSLRRRSVCSANQFLHLRALEEFSGTLLAPLLPLIPKHKTINRLLNEEGSFHSPPDGADLSERVKTFQTVCEILPLCLSW